MANEITIGVRLKALKGNLSVERRVDNVTADLAGSRYSANIQTVGTTKEQVVVGADVATPGWAYFRNHDSTHFVDIGVVVSGTFYPLLRLLPGENQVVRLATLTFYAQADTAAVDLESFVLEA